MNRCITCGYRFESAEALRRHREEGRGCPEDGGSLVPSDPLSPLPSDLVAVS